MDKETQAKFDALPQQVKDFMNSDEIPNKITAIGEKYGLHIDQIGVIQEEVAAVILGISKPESFIDAIEEHGNLPTEKAMLVATDINLQIFIPVKNLMTGSVSATPKTVADHTSIAREDLISAIENPSPSEHPISIAQPKPLEKTRPSSEATAVAHAFIGEKLSTPVSIPSQKTVVTPEVKKNTPSVDPYREPIN